MLQLLMHYTLRVLCCWPVAGADKSLLLLLRFFTNLVAAFNYIARRQTIVRFRDGCNSFHRYVGEILRVLRRNRWRGHVLILRRSVRTMWERGTANE